VVARRRALSLFVAVTLPLLWVDGVAATGVYVANTGDDTVSVIDPKTLAVTKVIGVGQQPGVSAMAANPAGTRVYVPNRLSNSVSVIDTASDTVIATVTGDDGAGVPFFFLPTAVAVSPDGAEAWVAGLGSVTIIETAGNTVVATIPHVCFDQPVANAHDGVPQAIAFHPFLSRAYVLSPDNSVGAADIHGNRLCVVDTEARTVVFSLTLPFTHPEDVAVRPDGAFVYVGGDAVQKIDAVTLAATPCCGTATRMAFGPGRHLPSGSAPFTLYATAFDNELYTIDPVIDVLFTGIVFPGADDVHGVTVAGDRAFVTATGSDSVRVVNLFDSGGGSEPTGPIAVGDLPRAIVAAVPAGADVGVTLTAPESARVGANVAYRIVVTNHGPVDATGVTLSDPLPGAATLISTSTTKGTCTGTLTVTCSLGSLSAGASATVTLTVRFTTADVHLNTATIDSTSGDLVSGNNTAVGRTSVTADTRQPGLIKLGKPTYAGDEGRSVQVTIQRVPVGSAPLAANVSVRYFTSDTGSAIAGLDYTAVAGTATFTSPTDNTKTVSIPLRKDDIAEGAETFRFTLAEPTLGATLGTPSAATITINDIDRGGVVVLDPAAYTVSESAGNVSVTLRRAGGSAANASVLVTTVNGTAIDGKDFGGVDQTVVFGPGQTTKTVTVPILQNLLPDGDRTFSVRLGSAGGGATIGTPSTASVKIQDDDSVIEFESTEFSAREGTPGVISVVRRGARMARAVVSYNLSGITAIPGVDFTGSLSGSLTFKPNAARSSFTIPTRSSNLLNGNRSVALALGLPTGAQLGPNSTARFIITDDDQPGVLRMGSASYRVREGAGSVSVDILRQPAPRSNGRLGANVSVSYATRSGNASAASDFTPVEGTAVFGARETRKTIRIPISQDALVEGRETFFVDLSSPSGGATLGSPSSASITIDDDDAGGLVFLSQRAYRVNEGAGHISITVVRSGGRAGNVSVDFATVPDSATDAGDRAPRGLREASAAGGGDYGAVFRTLTFAEGEMSKTVVVPISQDDIAESDETFLVTLSNPQGGLRLGNPASAPVTIVDDEVVVQFSGKFSNNQPEVVRTGPLTATVSVQYFAESGTAILGEDFVLPPGTLVFPPGVSSRLIPIKTINDNIAEGPETFTITLLNPSPPARLGPSFSREFRLDDNDFGGTVSFSSTRATAALGQSKSITIVRAGGAGTAMTVGWSAIGGTASPATDFSPASGQVTFPANQSARTFVVTIATAASTAGKTIVFGLTIPGGGAAELGAANTSTLTILVPPLVRFEAPVYEVTEADGEAILTLIREGDLAPAVTVQYTTADRTARAGADYTATAGTATFAAGQSTTRLTVPILGDTDLEATEELSVVLGHPTGGAVLTTPSTAVIRIADVPPPKQSARFSGLAAPTIPYGTVATPLGGTLTAGALVPTGVVRISVDGHTEEAVIRADGTFAATFDTGTLTVLRSPYTITYEYGGDARFEAVSDNGTLRVTRAAQTITFGALTGKIFGDADFTVSATAGSGLPVAFTAAGNCLLVSADTIHLTGAGACTVTARQGGDDNYAPAVEAAQSFPIARAAATLSLGASVFVFDGTPKAVQVTTTPTGLSGVSVTYDGSFVAPSEAGRHAVVASLTHDDYQAAPATGTLVIVRADAGPDRTVNEGEPVTLDGSSSVAAAYEWTQLAGAVRVALAGADTRTATFTAPVLPGGLGSTVLTFQLVSGDGAVTTSDTVNVTVKNVNHPPVPDPGHSRTVNEGSLVSLNGSRSYDPDGDPLVSYEWRQTSGLPVTLVGGNTATATFIAPFLPGGVSAGETFTFTLTVSDGELSRTSAEVAVTVEQVDHAPTAAAGDPQTVPVNGRVTLAGRGSDPDGDAIAFAWRQTAGPAVTLSDSRTAAPAFTAPSTPGQLVFELVTSDGRLTSEASSTTVSVVAAGLACDSARAYPSTLWPPNHRLVAVDVVGVVAGHDDAITITVTGVTQDEPTNGLGDGDTEVDAVLARGRLLLRAERAGGGDGRVYRVTFRADTARGENCTGAVTVGVPRDGTGNSAPIDSGQAYRSLR
jgi:uncharacterized repeat protein (TIGR01451 family)